ncbi:MAG: hypothetical protein BWZ09_02386 [Alphaproteobacteria bacterium ADurb.BinA305]|nr:MAG: hypothetical protein BWZ09_02386 [Alphaproteobacteria bacterium ADurb.BinA305]
MFGGIHFLTTQRRVRAGIVAGKCRLAGCTPSRSGKADGIGRSRLSYSPPSRIRSCSNHGRRKLEYVCPKQTFPAVGLPVALFLDRSFHEKSRSDRCDPCLLHRARDGANRPAIGRSRFGPVWRGGCGCGCRLQHGCCRRWGCRRGCRRCCGRDRRRHRRRDHRYRRCRGRRCCCRGRRREQRQQLGHRCSDRHDALIARLGLSGRSFATAESSRLAPLLHENQGPCAL